MQGGTLMRKVIVAALAAVCATAAHASTIDYIIVGSGSGELAGSAWSGTYEIDIRGDPANVEAQFPGFILSPVELVGLIIPVLAHNVFISGPLSIGLNTTGDPRHI